MLYKLATFSTNTVLRLFFCKIKISGKENFPKKGGFILASNHMSNLDPAVLAAACPRRLNFMAKKELFDIPIFSNFISAVGAFPVKRNSADISALKQAIKLVNSGKGLLVFPEGSRKGGSSDDPLAGVGFLAAKTNAPVIPALVSGTDKAMPKGSKFIKRAEICVKFGKQISLERRMPYKDIAKQVMDNIRHLS